jgi:thiol-disulfide isomerase/thioredoxin
MKTILILFFVVIINNLLPQEKFKSVIDEKSGKPMLVGEITREAFKDTSYSWWFNSEYEMYKPDKVILDSIKQKLENIEITMVIGTWCSDSRREMPRFFKILDSLNFSQDKVKLIAVDRDKRDLNGEAEKLSIELVPTFIFYSDGKEMGRITEAPVETLEKDMNRIIWRE